MGKIGYVYLVHTSNKYYKVGYTNNIKHRQKAYNTHNPNAKIVEYIQLDDQKIARLYEKIAHDEIGALYGGKEWFQPSTRVFHLNYLVCLEKAIVIKNR
jgi:hypothetical protein